jgi:superfamily II DNA helicase RecQ
MAHKRRSWTVEEIRDLVQLKLGKRPCWFQIKIALAIYQKKDVVGTAATGAGKTLSFWIALLMALEDGENVMEFIVTPLNILGKQTIKDLEGAGIRSISVSKENADALTFKVRELILIAKKKKAEINMQDINDGKYHIVVINPEILMGSPHVDNLWRNTKLTSRILCFIIDEGHCVSEWGSFRTEYPLLGNLRYLIAETVPIYTASATMPMDVLHDVTEVLHLRSQETEHITCSNDRPNIHLVVQEIKHAVSSYADLAFLIPDNFSEGDVPPKKFLVFFDSTKEAEAATRYLGLGLGYHLGLVKK